MNKSLAGKVALVTGGARGIGRACVLALAEQGARVASVDLNPSEDALSIIGDISKRQTSEDMVERVVAEYGRLDILVANAAKSKRAPFLELDPQDAEAVIAVVQMGVYHACQCAARQMAKQGEGGNIVIISSVHALMPFAKSAPYNMAKAAVNHLARSIAAELAPHRIRVNAIEPGWTDTPGERSHFSEETIREEGAKLPLGRLAQPSEIANGVAWLVSDQAAYVTGSILRIDGGIVLPRP